MRTCDLGKVVEEGTVEVEEIDQVDDEAPLLPDAAQELLRRVGGVAAEQGRRHIHTTRKHRFSQGVLSEGEGTAGEQTRREEDGIAYIPLSRGKTHAARQRQRPEDEGSTWVVVVVGLSSQTTDPPPPRAEITKHVYTRQKKGKTVREKGDTNAAGHSRHPERKKKKTHVHI